MSINDKLHKDWWNLISNFPYQDNYLNWVTENLHAKLYFLDIKTFIPENECHRADKASALRAARGRIRVSQRKLEEIFNDKEYV